MKNIIAGLIILSSFSVFAEKKHEVDDQFYYNLEDISEYMDYYGSATCDSTDYKVTKKLVARDLIDGDVISLKTLNYGRRVSEGDIVSINSKDFIIESQFSAEPLSECKSPEL
jgi:hypothetical protein